MTRGWLFGLSLGVMAAVVPGARAARGDDAPVDPKATRAEIVARGQRLVRQGECARCHETGALPGVGAFARRRFLGNPGRVPEPSRDGLRSGKARSPPTRSCAGCHAWIHASVENADVRAQGQARYPLWDQYVGNVHSYLAVPDLAAAGARLDPAWVSRFLRAPHKIRPGFTEAMIRTPLSARDADAVAAFLETQARPPRGLAARAAAVPTSARVADVEEGERLYNTLQCASCHAFGERAAAPGIPAAPDLRHARARMRPEAIAAVIADPTLDGAHPGTRMPRYDLDARAIARLRDFIVNAPLQSIAIRPPSVDRPLLGRPVTWNEVNRRVFSAVCSHCHSDGADTGGDGGPGNTGGLGFRGAGLDLGSWRGVQNGARRPDGRRVSILVPGPGESEAPLVARLRRRMHEHAAEATGAGAIAGIGAAPVGMPLGLAPIDDELFRLVRTWVAQGANGPRRALFAGRREGGQL